MDGDPAIEPEFDTFSLILPLPYRVACIIVLGAWAWGLNLHYLHLLKIDVPALIRYPARPSPRHTTHHHSTYRLATFLTVPLAISLFLFWTLTHLKPSLVQAFSPLPNLYLLFLPIAFFLPIRGISPSGRRRFLQTLRRVSIGGLADPSDGKFGDILLADVLTSYAKVLGDLFITVCMMVSRGSASSTVHPNRSCGGTYIVPFLISVPSLIRLRQCLIEYVRVRRALEKGEADSRTLGWGGQHLGNALKYSSAFPVIILSAFQRGSSVESGKSTQLGLGETALFRLWLFFVFVNSFYSFYWDVAKDWDLELFSALYTSFRQWWEKVSSGHSAIVLPSSPSSAAPVLNISSSGISNVSGSSSTNAHHHTPLAREFPYGLRRNRFIHAPIIYYIVIGIDLLLRCTWSFKLSPHLDHFNNLEGGIFFMEMLEVVRRWIWIFLRVETEWVRNNRGPAPDDVLLNEFHNGKLDDD